MNIIRKLPLVIYNPIRALYSLGWIWASYLLKNQIIERGKNQKVINFDKKHYNWIEDADEFIYSLFCIQETNLIMFTKNFTEGKKFKKVAEIGANSDLILKHINADKKIGVNVQNEILSRLEGQGIEARKSDGKRIPLENDESELTICFETLEHVQDPISFLLELERVTCIGGKVLLSIPWVQRTNILSKFHGGTNKAREQADNHIFEFSKEDLKNILSFTSLKIEKFERLDNYLYQYDWLSNYLLKKHYATQYFPAIQAYILTR